MTTRVDEDTRVHSMTEALQVSAPMTKVPETRRVPIVTTRRGRGHLPWTYEVGVDARGAALAPTSVLARW